MRSRERPFSKFDQVATSHECTSLWRLREARASFPQNVVPEAEAVASSEGFVVLLLLVLPVTRLKEDNVWQSPKPGDLLDL